MKTASKTAFRFIGGGAKAAGDILPSDMVVKVKKLRGCGIKGAVRRHWFSPFSRARTTRKEDNVYLHCVSGVFMRSTGFA